MAQINSYPVATPELRDLLIGTEIPDPELTPRLPVSKNFSVGALVTLAATKTLEDGINSSFIISYGGVLTEFTITSGIITKEEIVG